MMSQLRSDERGVTIIEVLIVASLTMVITGVAMTTFLHANRTATSATALTDVNHNLRVAMNIVIRDLIQTGTSIPTGGIPLPKGGAAADVVRPGPVGAELTFPAEWETLPAVTPGPALGPVVRGTPTDMLTVLRIDPTIQLNTVTVQNISADGSTVTMPAGFAIDDDATGIKEGDLIMLSNGNGNAIQEVTSVVGQSIIFSSTAESGLNQPNAPQGSVMELRNADTTWPPTTATRILMLTYYLTDLSNGGTEIPSLVRRTNYGPERILATGIENFQLSWDLVDGVDNPTNVDFPEEPNTPHQIRKANLHMGARSIDPTPTGHLLHASLTTQVSLRSMAFVDRYK